jgi:hypothetical protein
MTQQDAAFYTHGTGVQDVWLGDDGESRFYVVRNGEMRIHAKKTVDGEETIIRYSDQLEEFGVKTDEQLHNLTENGELFNWINNSWFEVWDRENSDSYSDVVDELDAAISYAKELCANPALAEWE